jgi:hypothetical protein
MFFEHCCCVPKEAACLTPTCCHNILLLLLLLLRLLLLLLLLLLQGITTAIAYQHGMGSSAFAVAVALSSIVMYDAAGVRRHAGAQGHPASTAVSCRQ